MSLDGDLDAPTIAADAAVAASNHRPSTTPAAIHRYAILDKLGEGGMGVVYAAYDPALDRRVAVKLVRASSRARTTSAARLAREAQAMAKLAHPNVVAVHDVGVFEDQVFVAMEFVEGQTLADWFATGPDWRAVVETMIGAARGLAEAHRHGIVHRDFKPDNVLIGADGRPRVMDFGLARSAESERTEASADGSSDPRRDDATFDPGAVDPGKVDPSEAPTASVIGALPTLSTGDAPTPDPLAETTRSGALQRPLTREGAIMGTPAYMPPEQIRGLPADARADQFSFCVALYEGVYGHRPFRGSTVVHLWQRSIAGEFEPPPKDTPVAPEVFAVIERGLSPRPEDRWPSLDAVVDALEAVVAPEVRIPAWRWWLGVGLAGAFATALIAALVVDRDPPRDRCADSTEALDQIWHDDARAGLRSSFEAAGLGDTTLARATVETLDRYAVALGAAYEHNCRATRERAEQSDRLMDLRRQCLDRRRAELAAATSVLATALDPETALEVARQPSPIAVCADVEALTARVPLPDDPTVRERVGEVEATLARVEALEATGRFVRARELLATISDDDVGLVHPPTAARRAFADARARTHDAKLEATPRFLEAATLAAAGGDDRLWSAIFLALGQHVLDKRDRPEVGAAYLHALDTRLHGPANTADAGLRFELERLEAELMIQRAQFDEAEAFFVERLATMPVTTDEDLLRRSVILMDLGAFYTARGRPLDARVRYEAAAGIREQLIGDADPTLVKLEGQIANTYSLAGEVDEARRRLDAAEARSLELFGETGETTIWLGESQAYLDFIAGDFASAKRRYLALLEARQSQAEPSQTEIARMHANVGAAATSLDELDLAVAHTRESLDYYIREFGEDSPQLIAVHNTLAEALTGVGAWDEAWENTERAKALLDEYEPDNDIYMGGMWHAKMQVATGRGDYEAAVEYGLEAVALQIEVGSRLTVARSLYEVLELILDHRVEHEYPRVPEMIEQCREAATEAGGAPGQEVLDLLDEMVGQLPASIRAGRSARSGLSGLSAGR